MPTYDAFCRTPLVDPAYVALPDSAVHLEGALERLVQQALELVDLNALTPLDAVLATKLGGYTDLPPMPGLTSAAAALPEDSRAFMDAVRAGLNTADSAIRKALRATAPQTSTGSAGAVRSTDKEEYALVQK